MGDRKQTKQTGQVGIGGKGGIGECGGWGMGEGEGGGWGGTIRAIDIQTARQLAAADKFIARTIDAFEQRQSLIDRSDSGRDVGARRHRYARAVRSYDNAQLLGLILVERDSPLAARSLVMNAAYLFSAGLIAGAVAVLVFYLITNRLILSPVRALRETAEKVRSGRMSTRSFITTGDEFEELSDTFNAMLEEIARSQRELRSINASLDLKVNELAERNVALFEANKLKGEFLANVSHELRTPLNSIIGFGELLLEVAEKDLRREPASGDAAKRKRYLENIITSGKSLLEMINGLLEMARVEAGKHDLKSEPMNVSESCEALASLIRPFASKHAVEVRLETPPTDPIIHTDPRKFQQIVYNLLSNAVKFTGGRDPVKPDGRNDDREKLVTLRVEPLRPETNNKGEPVDRVRISILDTGPGIAQEHQQAIFEKFHQIEQGHTRKHAGAGLGLAIVRELVRLLQGEIIVQSELGRGAMFSLILPSKLDPQLTAEQQLESAFRGALSARRTND